MPMEMEDCFALLARRRTDEIVVTAAGNSSELWWDKCGDLDYSYYLEASMSLSTMFAAGIAQGFPEARFWAFIGDGAFMMNTGVIFTERDMALPNMVTLIFANGCYGATDAVDLPVTQLDYVGLLRSAGLSHVYRFGSTNELDAGFDEAFCSHRPTTVVLDLEPPRRHYPAPPFDGPEIKYRFGRALERRFGRKLLP